MKTADTYRNVTCVVNMIKVGSNLHTQTTPNKSRAAHFVVGNQPQVWSQRPLNISFYICIYITNQNHVNNEQVQWVSERRVS